MGRNESGRCFADTVAGKTPAATGAARSLYRGSSLGRYIIIEMVGTGGMGVVYAAYDPELDRRVAIKLLHPFRDGSGSAGTRARLLREAQALARVTHPSVIPVYDVGMFEDEVFLVEEYLDGGTLASWTDGKRPWREVLEAFYRAGRGLHAAHAAGIVHRDFKPENVLLGRDGRVRVTDFGLARAEEGADFDDDTVTQEIVLPDSGRRLSAPLTEQGAVVGTPAYMSPEQHRGQAADARSDQFSFCVSLYEALYGERPFASKDTTCARVREAPTGSQVPTWLRRVLMRGLSADRVQRFASMSALLDALSVKPKRRQARRAALAAALAIACGGALAARLAWRASSPEPRATPAAVVDRCADPRGR
jgi:serine/threonine protein kinase